MAQYQYKVVPAPTKGVKAKGVRTVEGRFAHSVESVLNTLGAEGWEYCRAELLPSEERAGLTGSATKWRNVLVFRRLVDGGVEVFQPQVLDASAQVVEEVVEVLPEVLPESVPVAPVAPVAPAQKPASPPLFRRDPPVSAAAPVAATGAERMLKDNGVEELSDVAGVTTALKTLARQRTENAAGNAAGTTAGAAPDEPVSKE